MAAAVESGLSSLGVLFGYGLETTKGTKPTAFNLLDRVNNIGGISLSVEQIDASALADEISRYVAGRQDTGGTWSVTFNLTSETMEQLEEMITDYNGLSEGKRMWFEVYHPSLTDGFFVVAQPPQNLPMPEIGQNELLTIELTFIIEEYKGSLTAVKPVAKS